jgi:hypothetical protein
VLESYLGSVDDRTMKRIINCNKDGPFTRTPVRNQVREEKNTSAALIKSHYNCVVRKKK